MLDQGQGPTSHYSQEVEIHAFLNSIDVGEQPLFVEGALGAYLIDCEVDHITLLNVVMTK
jgi:hypothetical protein